MGNTQAELLGNDIVNFIRHNAQGMVADGWRDADTASLYELQLSASYKDDVVKANSEFFVASDKDTSDKYRETCKEHGVSARNLEVVEYKTVLFPYGAGKWDLTVWVRDHSDVDHWLTKEEADGNITLQVFTSKLSRHIGRPLARWELMAARTMTEVTAEYIQHIHVELKTLLDAHLGRINAVSDYDMLVTDRSEGLYV